MMMSSLRSWPPGFWCALDLKACKTLVWETKHSGSGDISLFEMSL